MENNAEIVIEVKIFKNFLSEEGDVKLIKETLTEQFKDYEVVFIVSDKTNK